MANKACDLNRKDVGYCYKNVKKLIAAIPSKIFEGKLADKKECADKGLEELDKFFFKLKDITKEELNEYTGIKDKCKGLFDMVCGRTRPTVDFP